MRWLLRAVGFALFALLVGASSAHAQRGVALVIGNSAYQNTAPLANPKNDATDVSAALKAYGFTVIEGFDLDKAGMDRTIRDFADALYGAQVALFFYAGHGLQVGGQNYLVPIDAKLSTPAALDFEMIRLEVVHRSMEREVATSILFVDACRNNPLARNLARAMGTRSAEIGRGLAQVEAGVGTLVSFSTQPGNVALDGTGRNSPFAGALVKHMGSSHEDLSAILIAVRNDVMKETQRKQVPWEHSALTGKFYFNPAAALAPQVGPSAPSEVERAWEAAKDTADKAVLEAFVVRFGDSFYAELARARLRGLEQRPSAGVTTGPAPAASASAREHPFDGTWEATFAGGEKCTTVSGTYTIDVQGGVIQRWGGSVNTGGEASFNTPGQSRPNITVRHSLKLGAGTGTFETLGTSCTGTETVKRVGRPAVAQPATAVRPVPGGNQGRFAGTWTITRSGQNCRGGIQFAFQVIISHDVVGGNTAFAEINGTIGTSGTIKFSHKNSVKGGPDLRYVGKLADKDGSGTFSSAWGDCRGTFTATLQ